MQEQTGTETSLRERATVRVKQRSELRAHVLAWATVNIMLTTIWAVTGAGFFWPAFPIVGWGIAVAFHALAFFGEPSETSIQREMEHLRAG